MGVHGDSNLSQHYCQNEITGIRAIEVRVIWSGNGKLEMETWRTSEAKGCHLTTEYSPTLENLLWRRCPVAHRLNALLFARRATRR